MINEKNRAMRILMILIFFTISNLSKSQYVNTYAGILDSVGSNNGLKSNSRFNNPHGIAISNKGEIYIADRFNHVIRKIDTNGIVSTYAGSGVVGSVDGLANQASFNEPWDIEIDSKGNIIVADTRNNLIRKITPSGIVSTIAGTGNFGMTDHVNGLSASFGNPSGIAIDGFDNVYVADHLTHLIRKITPTGSVSTLAGSKQNYPSNYGRVDGTSAAAKFYRPYGISFGFDGNLYVADEWNHSIRKVSLLGIVTTIAGNGTIGNNNGLGSQSTFNYPWDIIQDEELNLYVLDGYNNVIRKIDTNLLVEDFIGISGDSGGDDGDKTIARFDGATGLTYNNKLKKIYVSDSYNQLIREVLIQNPQPKISLDTNLICQNDLISIKVTPQIYESYQYFVNDSLILTSANHEEFLSISDFGIISLKVKGISNNYNLTSDYSYLNSFPNPKPIITPSAYKLSIGDSIILNCSGFVNYNWSNGDSNSNTIINTPGVYFVQTKNQFGCWNISDGINISIEGEINTIDFNIKGDTNICPGDTVILTSKKGNPIWYKNNIPVSSTNDSMILVTEPGAYYYVSFDNGIAYFSDTINFQLVYPDSIRFNITDTAFYDSIFTFPIYSIDTNIETILWSNGSSKDTLYVSNFGKYSLKYKSKGCIVNSDTISILNIDTPPSLDILVGSLSFCKGDSIVVKANHDSCVWYFNSDTIKFNSDTAVIYDSGNLYYTILWNGTKLFSDTLKISAFSPVKPRLSISNDTILWSDETLKIACLDSGLLEWHNYSNQQLIMQDSSSEVFVKLLDSNGCTSVSDTIRITVNNIPSVRLSMKDTSICEKDSLLVKSLNNFTGWLINDSIYYDTSDLKVKSNQLISAFLDSNGRRFYSDTINVTILSINRSNLVYSGNLDFYLGDSIIFHVNSGSRYNWHCSDTSKSITIYQNDTVWCQVTDTNGCKINTDTLITTVTPLPILSIFNLGDSTICPGDSSVLMSNVPNPKWHHNGIITGDSTTSLVAKKTGYYYYTYLHNNDTLLISDTLLLNQYNPSSPVLNVINDTSIYEGQAIQVSCLNYFSGYTWFNNDTLSNVLIDSASQVFMFGVDSNGCITHSDTVLINIIELPSLKIDLIGDSGLCSGESSAIKTNRINAESINWYRNGYSLGISTEELSVSEEGYYYYKTYFLNDTILVSDSIYIEIYELPVIDFEVDNNRLTYKFNKINPSPISSDNIVSYSWNFGDDYAGDLENNSALEFPTHQYVVPGNYSITLTVTDINNCSSTITKEDVVMMENDLFIPSGFTPNGDGNNDLFRPLGGGIVSGNMLIFNQWGELIFESNDLSLGWNGKRDGQLIEPANYTYWIQINLLNGDAVTKKGIVTLVR